MMGEGAVSELRRAQMRAAEARCRALNREAIRGRQRLQKRSEDAKAAYRSRYAADPQKFAGKHARYRAHHPSKMREVAARWRAANPERVHDQWVNRHKLKSGRLSSGLKARLFERQMGLCAHCLFDLGACHLDHRVPLARGGCHCDDNMQLLCAPCNLRKGARYVW